MSVLASFSCEYCTETLTFPARLIIWMHHNLMKRVDKSPGLVGVWVIRNDQVQFRVFQQDCSNVSNSVLELVKTLVSDWRTTLGIHRQLLDDKDYHHVRLLSFGLEFKSQMMCGQIEIVAKCNSALPLSSEDNLYCSAQSAVGCTMNDVSSKTTAFKRKTFMEGKVTFINTLIINIRCFLPFAYPLTNFVFELGLSPEWPYWLSPLMIQWENKVINKVK